MAEGSEPVLRLSSEYTPQGVDLYMERSNLIGIIIAGVIYGKPSHCLRWRWRVLINTLGILFTIFVQCVLALSNSNAHKKNQARIFIAYSCIIFILATFGFAGNTKFVQMTYIDYRNFPGGPNDFTFAFYTEFCNVFSIGSYVIMNWFADGLMVCLHFFKLLGLRLTPAIQLYRFSVIYDRKPLLMIVPTLMYLSIVGTLPSNFSEPTPQTVLPFQVCR